MDQLTNLTATVTTAIQDAAAIIHNTVPSSSSIKAAISSTATAVHSAVADTTGAIHTAIADTTIAIHTAVHDATSGLHPASPSTAAPSPTTRTPEQLRERVGTYKYTHTLQQRLSEYHVFRRLNAAGHVQVMLETSIVPQKKLSVRADLRFGEFVFLVRKRQLPKVPASTALWCMVGVEHELPHVAMTMAQIHARHADFDGWLYVVVREETTFGMASGDEGGD